MFHSAIATEDRTEDAGRRGSKVLRTQVLQVVVRAGNELQASLSGRGNRDGPRALRSMVAALSCISVACQAPREKPVLVAWEYIASPAVSNLDARPAVASLVAYLLASVAACFFPSVAAPVAAYFVAFPAGFLVPSAAPVAAYFVAFAAGFLVPCDAPAPAPSCASSSSSCSPFDVGVDLK